ncbi:MAG: DUF4266 domain-containing protein [Polyangiales bacterium]
MAIRIIILLATLFAVGCTHVSPWQRGTLAHPSMSSADLSGPGEEHLRAVQEGATGGGSAAASGCGCN